MNETLPLRDAATRLSISERTLRRRLQEGTIAGHQVATAQGYRWLVELPEASPIPTVEDYSQVVGERDAYRQVIDELLSEMRSIRGLLEEAADERQAVKAAPGGQSEAPPESKPERRWWHALVWG